MQIQPILHPLNASVQVPGSKSLTNRALLIAALASGRTALSNALFSDDSRYFSGALAKLGFSIHLNEAGCSMDVDGLCGQIPVHRAELYIGNAGTAARFLSAFLTLGQGEFILDGDDRMRERPIGDLISALSQLGAQVQPSANNCPPVRIFASGLPGGMAHIAGDVSSQFLSALLMVAPYAQKPVEVILTTELNSRPYVDMTIAVMRDFGIQVERDGYQRFCIQPAEYRSPGYYAIESDASAASYFFAAPVVCGGLVEVTNISRHSLQGDIAFLDVLQRMGCQVRERSNSIAVSASHPLNGVDVDMRDIPDTAQTLAAIAPFATTPTRIRGIASARVKETDRVAATCAELSRLGAAVEEHPDGMTIYPSPNLRPAVVRTYNDHRMAMAFSLPGLRVSGISIENPTCVAKTFPNFYIVLASLS